MKPTYPYSLLAGVAYWPLVHRRIEAAKFGWNLGKEQAKKKQHCCKTSMDRNMKWRNQLRLELSNMLLRLQQRLEAKAQRSMRGTCPCCGDMLTLHETGIFRCDKCRYDKDGKVKP